MENKFYSYLTDIKVTVKEYEHLINVWKKFEVEKMKEYHGLCDVLFIAENDESLKLIFNILQKYTNYVMIIL